MSNFHDWNKKIVKLFSSRGENLQTGRTRLRIIQSFSLILFALVLIRLCDLTMMQPAIEPRVGKTVLSSHTLYDRADIVDRNGTLLATTLQVPSLYADPTLIENKAYIAQRLESILGVENVIDDLNRKGRFVWIKRGLSPEEHFEVNALGSPGLAFRNEPRRFYPQGNLTAHLVGYTSVDGQGLAGLERHYNDILSKGENPLILNADIRIQHALAKSLKNHLNIFKAKAAMGGVIDIQTGEIIAAVSLPDFDPHHAGKANEGARFNRFAHGVYEMGSTFKLFSTAAYLEEKDRPFSQTFDARFPLEEGRFTINDFHAEKRILTLPEVFVHSSNIGSALMGRAIGDEMMQQFYRDLGLMEKINADFPALSNPLVPSPWRNINTLTASYGHGIAVTPLHVLKATAAIANNGIIPEISFAKTQQKNTLQSRILSASTAYKMRQLLRLNVTNGSGANADIAGYHVGGKTGTSEKVGAGGYDKDKLLSSFVGVFPIDNPRYAVLAIFDEPKGNKASFGYATGGWVAAPAVGQTIADMTRILGLTPNPDAPNMIAGLDRYLKQTPTISPINFQQ
jgi:cell division protein FtsI (penicillin-binding protein 3)